MAFEPPSSELKISVSEEAEAKKQQQLELIERGQWLRAAILGANDGLLSTTSLMLGVGAAKEDKWLIIISGLAGAIAGACSMAVGEFVSVSTQRDIGLQATINQSSSPAKPPPATSTMSSSMATNDNKATADKMHQPLSSYLRSPLMKVIARDALTPSMPLGEENERVEGLPNPYKAAGASGLAFLCGSLVPLVAAMAVSHDKLRVVAIVVASTIALAAFGGSGARLGGAPVRVSALRVVVGGWLTMGVTYGLLKPLDRDDTGHDIHK